MWVKVQVEVFAPGGCPQVAASVRGTRGLAAHRYLLVGQDLGQPLEAVGGDAHALAALDPLEQAVAAAAATVARCRISARRPAAAADLAA